MKSKIRSATLGCTAATRAYEMPDNRYVGPTEHPHFNENQLSERWGVSVKKLQADRLKGSGVPFIRLGRAVRYRHADVMAWEERHLHASTTTVVDADRVK